MSIYCLNITMLLLVNFNNTVLKSLVKLHIVLQPSKFCHGICELKARIMRVPSGKIVC